MKACPSLCFYIAAPWNCAKCIKMGQNFCYIFGRTPEDDSCNFGGDTV